MERLRKGNFLNGRLIHSKVGDKLKSKTKSNPDDTVKPLIDSKVLPADIAPAAPKIDVNR